jgi:rhamnogalacturonyl hydrolase YesR
MENRESVSWEDRYSPKTIAGLVIDDLLGRDDFMMYVSEHARGIHYAEACTGFGAAKFAGIVNDSSAIARLSQRYLRVIEDGIEITANHVDVNAYGILALELYMQTKDSRFFDQGIRLADVQWEPPLPNGLSNQTRYWIDDVWMIGSLQVQAYRATGKTIYLERAAMEIDSYLEELQQPNGLFHHGETAPFFWGRGNGWAAAGLAELLSELPSGDPHYPSIVAGYTKMMDTLLQHQAKDGMWRQLIDKEESWKETSCTGMFGYAISEGVRRGILPESEIATAYQRAWRSLTEYVTAEGKVTEVCVGTGQSKDLEFYLARPRIAGDLHGQAPVLWFACSLLSDQSHRNHPEQERQP